jgi:hypothetical protein
MLSIIIGSIPLLVALFVSAIYYKRPEPGRLWLFTWFLLFTFLVQTGSYLYVLLRRGHSNHFIFNSYTIIMFVFYACVYYGVITRLLFKKLVLYGALFFSVFCVYQVFFINHFFKYSPISYDVGGFLVLCYCCLYMTELLQSDEHINFFKTPMFWITTGIMISIGGNFLYISFFNYILDNKLDAKGNIYNVISTALSIIEYSLFAVGFYVKKNAG